MNMSRFADRPSRLAAETCGTFEEAETCAERLWTLREGKP